VSASQTRSLASIHEGHDVLITRIAGTGSNPLRLREMGLCEGRRVRVLRRVDPMICQIDECRVGLGQGLAEQIFVNPVDN
jgi:Fe2+ transport system protein FeoA